MSDLINRPAAIDGLAEYGNGRAVYISVKEAVRRIKQLPPIQPEIVRCGECKYHRKKICPIEKYFSLDGFCSRGER